jgi:hypothetical protein
MPQRYGRRARPRYPQWEPPLGMIRPPKRKRFGFLALGICVVAALLLGIAIGYGIVVAGIPLG